MMPTVLVADDDKNIAALISDNLKDEGIDTIVLYDGLQVLEVIHAKQQLDLVLLDIMMPGLDGLEVCKRIRDTVKCPIIFVTAKSRTLDTLIGLELGGDDYITKPFVVEELVGKIKAHIRRDKRNAQSVAADIITFGEFRINKDSYEVYKNGSRIEVTTREFQLLLYLYENIGKVLTREQIFDSVWGMDYFDMGTVTVTIKTLRDKIDPEIRYIKTVWGVGYKLVKGDSL
jgi:DNA-binding response OmpR family regulator